MTDGEEQFKERAPVASLLLAYAAIMPIAVGAAGALAVPATVRRGVERATTLWSAGVLCLLSGVRRGLSFRQPSGRCTYRV